MKINKIINIGLCVSLLSGLFIQPANAITKDYIYNDDYDKGVKIGSVIYDYDENGNIIERIVDDEGTITVAELYGRNIGQGDAIEAINEDAETASENDLTPIKEVEYYLINLKPDGTQEKVSTFTLYEEAIKAYDKAILENTKNNYCVVDNDNNFLKIKYGVVKFKSVVSNGYIKNISYKNAETGDSGYLNPSYGFDAAYIETKDGKVKFKMAGVIGTVDESLVEIIPYADKTILVSYYKVENGKMIHGIKKKDFTAANGYSGSYMNGYVDDSYSFKEKTVYYSYDGHYFYTDFFDMIDDYRDGDYDKAVNSKNPYYNYYQALSHRTKTIYSVEQINEFLENKLKNKTSVMKNTGKAFVDMQNIYGSNALLTMGVAGNESAWGTSNYARNRNNLFGHAAYDSNPDNATGYASVDESIQYHDQHYVSKGYASPTIWVNGKVVLGANYFGANLGHKGSGMNIKYASDPFWGEKNALAAYQINEYFKKEDFGRYSIGVKNVVGEVNIRKEATTKSAALYKTEELKEVTFVILDTVKGEKINGNDKWYKIVSDAPLTEDRTSYTTTNSTYKYDYSVSYAYISAEYVDVVFEGNQKGVKESLVKYEEPKEPEKPTPEQPITPPVEEKCKHVEFTIVNKKDATCTAEGHTGDKKCNKCGEIFEKGTVIGKVPHAYTKGVCACGAKDPNYVEPYPIGDVSGDYKVTSLDFIKIKNHIMKTKTMTDDELKRADVNGDGKVTSLDFIKVKNHIIGTNKLF